MRQRCRSRITHAHHRTDSANHDMNLPKVRTVTIPESNAAGYLYGSRLPDCRLVRSVQRQHHICTKSDVLWDQGVFRLEFPPSSRVLALHSRRHVQTQCSSASAPATDITDGEESYYDEDDVSPSPCYAESDSWSSTHLKKAQRRRQHDSSPGSQSLASRVRDVVRRPSLRKLATIPSRCGGVASRTAAPILSSLIQYRSFLESVCHDTLYLFSCRKRWFDISLISFQIYKHPCADAYIRNASGTTWQYAYSLASAHILLYHLLQTCL